MSKNSKNNKVENVNEKESKIEKAKKVKENIQENKALRVIGNILYTICFIVIVLVLLVVLVQRFSDNNISLAGYRMFNIVSESMIPKYVIGDIVIDQTIEPNEIKVGDDITYKGDKGDFKDRIVTHQVIAIQEENGEMKFQTKGIANDLPDPSLVSANQIYGKVVYKSVLFSLIGKITTNTIGFYVIIFIPIAILIALKIREIVTNMQEDDEEDDEEERKQKIESLKEERKKKNEKDDDDKQKDEEKDENEEE